jgi:hypothetical protein
VPQTTQQQPPAQANPPAGAGQAPGGPLLSETEKSALIAAEASRHDAKMAFRASIITSIVAAVVSILVAVGAFLGVVWSTKKSTEASREVVAIQTAADTKKSNDDFVRGQRQVLYPKILDDERAAYEAEKNYFRLAKQRPSLPDPTVHEASNDAQDDADAFRRDGENLDIASPATREKYDNLLKAHVTYKIAVDQYLVELGSAEKCATESCPKKFKDTVSAQDSVETSRTALIQAFNDDLVG